MTSQDPFAELGFKQNVVPINVSAGGDDPFSSLGFQSHSTPIVPEPTMLQKAGSIIDSIFGGGKIGEIIGSKIAELSPSGQALKKQEEAGNVPKGTSADTFSTPTGKEVAGSTLQSASLFFPIGRTAELSSILLGKVGLKTGASFLGKVTSGVAAGGSFDIAQNLQEGKTGADTLDLGAGAAIGGAIPLVGPVISGAGRLASESLGVSTGAGYGAIKELFNAAAEGGQKHKVALDAMRGSTQPTEIVQEARTALDTIKKSRTTAYVKQLASLKESTKTYDISPVITSVRKNLDNFGVHVAEDGALDFSRSPLRFNSAAQTDITNIVNTMKDFGSQQGDRTIGGLDSLKRAFGDLYSPSGEARAFVTSVTKSVRDVLKEVPGYDQMAQDYAQKTQLTNEIQKALSLGDKASVDTAFRKLTTVLRTNNEERKLLVKELDAVSGGKLTPMIAGQQMSELLPRGLARQIEGFGALGSIMAGFGAPLLKLALVASPRAVGELVNALGIGKRASAELLKTLGIKTGAPISPGDYVAPKIGKVVSDINKTMAGKGGMSIKDVSKLDPLVEDIRPFRAGQPDVLPDYKWEDTVARERFDIPKLKKVSFGGSDRDVYDLGNGDVLKVAKTARGLAQNQMADFYAANAGLIPEIKEIGRNYVVFEKVGAPDANTKKMVAELAKLPRPFIQIGGVDKYYSDIRNFLSTMEKYGYPGEELANYGDNLLYGDMSAIRNWGTKNGKPILLDEGSLNGEFVKDFQTSASKGISNLDNPEFKDIYQISKDLRKKYGDLDGKTMYGITGLITLDLMGQKEQ